VDLLMIWDVLHAVTGHGFEWRKHQYDRRL